MASKLKSWEKFSYEAKKFLVDLVVALGTVGLLLPKGTYSVLKVFGKRAIGLKALLTSAGKKIIAAAKLLGRKPETAKVLNVSDLKKKMKTKERKREFKKTKSGRRN
ncbi:hypothetical protein HY419_02180 [candidate division WWE3 bacterium]|nr:hypothetical protein [candidate division WWE3 bacterium]